ncbi:hypothetical protein HJFPF1_06325 [Paramyrothecium foliicola]|nr:hypothetical protein HJFPF1_06325 [Paramyrothecium foliicola]
MPQQAGEARGLQTSQVSFSEARKKDSSRIKTERQTSPFGLSEVKEQTTVEDRSIPRGGYQTSQTDRSDSKISSPTYLEQSISKQQLDSFEELYDDERPGSDSSSYGSSDGHNRQNLKKPTSGYKRQIREDDSDGQDDDSHGGDDRRDKQNKRTRRSAEVEREKIFACPYYKFAPDKFSNCRTCALPGFKEVHRVKEHVIRAHRLPEQCLRCCEYFKTEDALKSHAQSPKGCQVRERGRNLADGFDKAQERKLSERPRMEAEARWKHMYCILFNIEPGSPDIPSPYHEAPETSSKRASPPKRRRSQPITRVLRDRLPALVHTAVETQVWKATSNAEREILPKVIEDLRNSIQNAVHVLQNIPPPPQNYLDGKETMTQYQEAIPDDFDVNEFLACLPSALDAHDGLIVDPTLWGRDHLAREHVANFVMKPTTTTMILATIYMLASAALSAVAVFVHFRVHSLSLPVSPVVTILTATLPIASIANALLYPSLLKDARSSNRLYKIFPTILQSLQIISTTILATLLSGTAVSTAISDCGLELEWMTLFRSHDASSIKQIQDILNCCGFNTLKDRAYPFPGQSPSTCAALNGRHQPCKGLWREAMQSQSKTDLAVVFAVGLMQIISLLLTREDTNWWSCWRTRGRKMFATRPLLAAPEDDEETSQRQECDPRSYGTIAPEGPYEGPRLQPSAIHQRSEWDDEQSY